MQLKFMKNLKEYKFSSDKSFLKAHLELMNGSN